MRDNDPVKEKTRLCFGREELFQKLFDAVAHKRKKHQDTGDNVGNSSDQTGGFHNMIHIVKEWSEIIAQGTKNDPFIPIGTGKQHTDNGKDHNRCGNVHQIHIFAPFRTERHRVDKNTKQGVVDSVPDIVVQINLLKYYALLCQVLSIEQKVIKRKALK